MSETSIPAEPLGPTQIDEYITLVASALHEHEMNVSRSEYYRRQMGALSYVASLSDVQDLSEDQRKENLKKIENFINTGDGTELSEEFRAGVDRIFLRLTPNERKEIEQGFRWFDLSLSVAGLGLTLISPPVGVALGISGLLVGSAPDFVDISTLSNEQRLSEIAAFSRARIAQLRKQNPDLRDALDNDLFAGAFGLDFRRDREGNLSALPLKYQDAFRDVIDRLDAGQKLTDAERENLQATVSASIDRNMTEWESRNAAEVRAIVSAESARIEEARRLSERSRKELKGAIYLGGFLAKQLFGEKFGAELVGMAQNYIQATQLMSAFAAGTLGPIGLAAGVLSIHQSLQGSGGNQAGFRSLFKALAKMRREMHERFDNVVDNQRVIMQRIDAVLEEVIATSNYNSASLKFDISEIVRFHRTTQVFEESSTRKELRSTVEDVVSRVEIELGDTSPNWDVVQDGMNELWSYAAFTSSAVAFSSSIDLALPDEQIASRIDSIQRPDYGVGLFAAITSGNSFSVMRNPYEWMRGVWAFLEVYQAAPPAQNAVLKKRLQELQAQGLEIRESLLEFSQREFFSNHVQKLIEELETATNDLNNAYRAFKRRNGFGRIEYAGAQIYPHAPPWKLDNKRLDVSKSVSTYGGMPPRGFLAMQSRSKKHYGDFFTVKGDYPIKIAQELGLISLELLERRTWTVWAKDAVVEDFATYKVKFNHGSLKGLAFGGGKRRLFGQKSVRLGLRISKVFPTTNISGHYKRIEYIPLGSDAKLGPHHIRSVSDLLDVLKVETEAHYARLKKKWETELKGILESGEQFAGFLTQATLLRYIAATRHC